MGAPPPASEDAPPDQVGIDALADLLDDAGGHVAEAADRRPRVARVARAKLGLVELALLRPGAHRRDAGPNQGLAGPDRGHLRLADLEPAQVGRDQYLHRRAASRSVTAGCGSTS